MLLRCAYFHMAKRVELACSDLVGNAKLAMAGSDSKMQSNRKIAEMHCM